MGGYSEGCVRAFQGDKIGDGSSRDGKNKIIKNRREDELCLTRRGRGWGGGGREEGGLGAPSESSGFHPLPLPPCRPVLRGSVLKRRCCRYQTNPFEDHLSHRKFAVHTALRYFSLGTDPLAALSVLWHRALSQRGDCSECSPIARLCFSARLLENSFQWKNGADQFHFGSYNLKWPIFIFYFF